MATQFISTNKNYKRLYPAPIDSSLVWDDISSLREYLKDPTCYLNMLVGCNGKAYIVVEKNGTKDIELIGNMNGDGSINDVIFIGNNEPTNDATTVWIDTSDINEYTGEISDAVIMEFKNIFKSMNDEIITLKKRVLALETNTSTGLSGYIIMNEDDDILINENNDIVVL